MALIRRHEVWDPFKELEAITGRMGELLGLAKHTGNGDRESLTETNWAPSCDIKETEVEYRVLAELPGVEKKDVHVTLEKGVLTIQGERHTQKEEKNEKLHRREMSYGSFIRRFVMPSDADEGKVNATFKDGMLTVVIAKSKAAKNTKEIAVN
ncbi:MAG: Hsp20/alpha crystallin family protein [Polyangiaceae bacterium]